MVKHTRRQSRRSRKTRSHGRKRTHRMKGGNNTLGLPSGVPTPTLRNRATGVAQGAATAVTGAVNQVTGFVTGLFGRGNTAPSATIGGKRRRTHRRSHKRRSHTRRH
jgi:hypothetical protein